MFGHYWEGLSCNFCVTPECVGLDTESPYLAAWRRIGSLLAGWYKPLPVNSMVRGEGAATSFFLKSERTKKNYFRRVRAFSRESARCYSEIEIDLYEERKDELFSICGGPVTNHLLMRLWLPNALGWSFLTQYGVVRIFGSALRRSLQIECNLAAARLIAALNAYRLAEGEYPQRLGELVPEYIGSIPRAPYDGEPMRYNPHLGVVYSVGKNLEDNGGEAILSAGEHGEDCPRLRWEADDIVFEIGI